MARSGSSPLCAPALVSKKQFAKANLSRDEEMIVAEASYRLRGVGHHEVRRLGRKFSGPRQAGGKFRQGGLTADPAIPTSTILALRVREC